MNIFSSSEAIVRGDLFQQCCDHIFWSNAHPYTNKNFEGGEIVFCKIDEVLNFFEKLRLTRKRIILITAEGDKPCDAFSQKFIPANVVHWFSTNVIDRHPKVSAIPLGLGTPNDLVTLSSEALKFSLEKSIKRDQWLYVGFRPETNKGIRQKIFQEFQTRALHESWITFEDPSLQKGPNSFLKNLYSHRFILCPPGNGVDTHRLWEALAAGAFPVALYSQALSPFQDLPILFVDHFSDLSLDLLHNQLPYLEEKRDNLFMLQMSFWEKKIASLKATLKAKEKMSWPLWFKESFFYTFGMIQRRFF